MDCWIIMRHEIDHSLDMPGDSAFQCPMILHRGRDRIGHPALVEIYIAGLVIDFHEIESRPALLAE